MTKLLLMALLFASFSTETSAHDFSKGAIKVVHPWARETAPGQQAGGGYMTIVNDGKAGDQLVSATSSSAQIVEFHSMEMNGPVMSMRRLPDGISVPAKSHVELKPGGMHVMFIGLKAPLRNGDMVPVTLRFRDAGALTVKFVITPIDAAVSTGMHHGH